MCVGVSYEHVEMSISSFFASLGAPLVNSRWSWGAQRPFDGAIFLRVFQEEKWIGDGRLHMAIGWGVELTADGQRPGYHERMRHVAAIRAGAPCFMVMCSAQDPTAPPGSWRIAFFDEDELRVGGKLVDRDGITYIEVAGRRRAMDMKVRE